MGETVSFIIPAYNVEKCISKCLDSFICPEIMDRIEVIVVNDGSTDSTHDIAQSYVDRYPEAFRVIDQENGGHGAAINSGTREARGRYFKVIDSDDWVVTSNLPAFVNKLEKCESDVVLTPYHDIDINTGEKRLWKLFVSEYERVYTFDEVMKDWRAFDRCFEFHGITYKTDFYQKHRYELPQKIYYEDQEYVTIPCSHAESIFPIDLIIYQYRVGDPEQSVSPANKVKRMVQVEQVIEDLLVYYNAHQELSNAAKMFFRKKVEGVVLSYYMSGCILDPDKASGRQACEKLNLKINKLNPELNSVLMKKYNLFRLMNLLHIDEERYNRFLHSGIYNMLAGKRQ